MNLNHTLEASCEGVPQEGLGAQASMAVVGWQATRLSNDTPPLQEVPVLQPYIQEGSNVTAEAKLVPPPGHNCAKEGGVSKHTIRYTSSTVFIRVLGLIS